MWYCSTDIWIFNCHEANNLKDCGSGYFMRLTKSHMVQKQFFETYIQGALIV